MVKMIESYECDICGKRWECLEAAVECESRGRPQPRPDLVGVIFGDTRPGAFYKDIVFALPEVYGDIKTLPIEFEHFISSCLWACRDNGYGDSIGDSYCGGNNYLRYERITGADFNYVNTELPAFKRMVKFLRERGLVPKVAMPDGSIVIWDKE